MGRFADPGYEIKMSDAEMAELLAERRDRDIVAGKKAETKPSDRDADASRNGNHHLADRQLQKALDYLDSELAKAP